MPNAVAARQALIKSSRAVGKYRHLVLSAPGIAEGVRPGQFAAIAVGGPNSAMVTRRAFSIHKVNRSTALEAQTLELIVAPKGTGSTWLTELAIGDSVDIISPLGKPFALPVDPVPCLLVGGGYGAAPLAFLGQELAARGCQVDFILGAGTEERLFGVLEAKRMATNFQITTDDGTSGVQGRVSDVMPDIMLKEGTAVVYACGPMPMLEAVARVAAEHGAVSQVAVEENMSCGVGVCMCCVLPVIGEDGVTRMTRSCVDGPVFRGNRVRWDSLDEVPADCLGSPTGGGH